MKKIILVLLPFFLLFSCETLLCTSELSKERSLKRENAKYQRELFRLKGKSEKNKKIINNFVSSLVGDDLEESSNNFYKTVTISKSTKKEESMPFIYEIKESGIFDIKIKSSSKQMFDVYINDELVLSRETSYQKSKTLSKGDIIKILPFATIEIDITFSIKKESI